MNEKDLEFDQGHVLVVHACGVGDHAEVGERLDEIRLGGLVAEVAHVHHLRRVRIGRIDALVLKTAPQTL